MTKKTTNCARFDADKCGDELWECACGAKHCVKAHSRVGPRGANVECKQCEIARRESEIPSSERLLREVSGISKAAERLNLGD